MNALVSSPAAVLRANGMIRAFAARDDDHLNAVMDAALDDTMEEHALVTTFGSLVWIAASLADRLARAGGVTVEQLLRDVTGPTNSFDRPAEPPNWAD